MLINILGCDGCGKSTQIDMLVEWAYASTPYAARSLAKKDIFDTERFPECDFFGVPYETLAHKLLPLMKEEARALWLIYMNMVLIKSQPPQENELVFLDGFWQKHYATEAALGIDKAWLRNVCSVFPEPDLTILIDMDPEVTVSRGHVHKPYESGCDFKCADASFIRHQKRVRSILLDLAQEKGYHVISGGNSKEAIFDTITAIITDPLETPYAMAGRD